MTREDAIKILESYKQISMTFNLEEDIDALETAIKALEQKPCENIEEIREVMSCDADAENKCKMISNILTVKPYYFKEQESSNDCSNCLWYQFAQKNLDESEEEE